jgi:hypothetical protein
MNAKQLAAHVLAHPEERQRFASTDTSPDYPQRFAVSAAVIARGGTPAQAQDAVRQWMTAKEPQ